MIDDELRAKWLEWFDGNEDLVNIFEMFTILSHTWDDLVDKDVDVSAEDINEAFKIALVYLPYNRLYQTFLPQILPMWVSVIAAYETANKFESDKDVHGIEISHSLRYSAGNIIAFLMVSTMPPDKVKKYMPIMWKSVMCERFDEYRKEHINEF